jgi:hypothetical protein
MGRFGTPMESRGQGMGLWKYFQFGRRVEDPLFTDDGSARATLCPRAFGGGLYSTSNFENEVNGLQTYDHLPKMIRPRSFFRHNSEAMAEVNFIRHVSAQRPSLHGVLEESGKLVARDVLMLKSIIASVMDSQDALRFRKGSGRPVPERAHSVK